jgi:hypothetical protein
MYAYITGRTGQEVNFTQSNYDASTDFFTFITTNINYTTTAITSNSTNVWFTPWYSESQFKILSIDRYWTSTAPNSQSKYYVRVNLFKGISI